MFAKRGIGDWGLGISTRGSSNHPTSRFAEFCFGQGAVVEADGADQAVETAADVRGLSAGQPGCRSAWIRLATGRLPKLQVDAVPNYGHMLPLVGVGGEGTADAGFHRAVGQAEEPGEAVCFAAVVL